MSRRAKDGYGKMSLVATRRLGRVERLAVGRAACPQSLATGRAPDGHPVCPGTPDRHHLAASRRGRRRLPGLLLQLGRSGTQEPIGRHATAWLAAAALAAAGSAADGDRRLAHEALRAKGRRGRHPSQSHTRTGRSKVSVWPYLGHPVPGAASSTLGAVGPALAGDAVRAGPDDGQDSCLSQLAVPHEVWCWRPNWSSGRPG